MGKKKTEKVVNLSNVIKSLDRERHREGKVISCVTIPGIGLIALETEKPLAHMHEEEEIKRIQIKKDDNILYDNLPFYRQII